MPTVGPRQHHRVVLQSAKSNCLYATAQQHCQLFSANADGPRDALRHTPSTIALYTKVDAECDQQLTVVGRLLTAPGHAYRRQVLSTTDRRLSLVYRTQ